MAVTQEGLVLYYVHDDKKVQIEALCLNLNLRAKQLKTSDLNERTGVLAEIKGLKMTEVSQNEKAPILFQKPEILIFSGIPEKKLDEFLAAHGSKIDKVLDIAVEKEELITRLTGRRVCKACGASYHVVNIPPKTEGICDACGGELVQRADDNIETVTNRIDVYEAQTKPLVDYYEKAGNIAHIDGRSGLDNVFADIVKALGE